MIEYFYLRIFVLENMTGRPAGLEIFAINDRYGAELQRRDTSFNAPVIFSAPPDFDFLNSRFGISIPLTKSVYALLACFWELFWPPKFFTP